MGFGKDGGSHEGCPRPLVDLDLDSRDKPLGLIGNEGHSSTKASQPCVQASGSGLSSPILLFHELTRYCSESAIAAAGAILHLDKVVSQ